MDIMMKRLPLAALVCVVSLLVVSWPASLFADDAADIDAVEREIMAEDRAMEIVMRARERAEVAVRSSSIGKNVERLQAEFRTAKQEFENTEAYRQYLGSDQLGAFSCTGCSSDEYLEKSHEHNQEQHARYMRFEETRKGFRLEELSSEAGELHKRMRRLIEKMTDRFIEDEINRAKEQDMRALERELRKMRKTSTDIHDA